MSQFFLSHHKQDNMASSSRDTGQDLTEPPVELSTTDEKDECRTDFLMKVTHCIRGVEDPKIRGRQRSESSSLLARLQSTDDGPEVAYRRHIAKEMRAWLLEAQELWEVNLVADFERLLQAFERNAKAARERKKAKEKLEKRAKKESEKWVLLDKLEVSNSGWEML